MSYVQFELKGVYREIGSQVKGLGGASTEKSFRFDRFFERIEKVAAGRSVQRVLVVRRENFHAPPFGALTEIASALQRLVNAGKQVYYYAPSYTAADCVLAAVCTHRVIHPLGTMAFQGLGGNGLFFKKFLEKHRIGVEVMRRGRYKSAADPFRTKRYDKHNRLQLQALIDGAVESMKLTASTIPPLNENLLDEMLQGRVLTAAEAHELRLVEELVTENDLLNSWKKAKVRAARLPKARGKYGAGPRIAVLVYEGAIVDGDSRRDPLIGQAVGDVPMVKAIRALKEARRTKAVVFRINSGGGSATASENVLRELVALNEKKPVVVSMGPIAGSGGYWISTTGRRLFALPTTITGSIGVLTLYFNLADMLGTYGITTDSVKCGESADLGSALRPITDRERETIDGVIEFLYRQFVDRVAVFRGKTPDQVHELAEGRLWLGSDALDHGLVDEIGGLHDAIAHAKGLIGAKRARVSFGPRVKQSLVAQLLAARSATVTSSAAENAAIHATAATIGRACLSLHGKPLFIDPTLALFRIGDDCRNDSR